MRYLDTSGERWEPDALFGNDAEKVGFDLSFDRYCSVEKVYIFR